ncbi:hypothetical protein [Enterococcus sp.]|uniref:hypothetical protein n=1 Tax=Enterococcus sp. TaxID=35783 RepID=UPI002FC94557
MVYKVNVDGKEIIYGPLVTKSRFSEKEWDAIHREIATRNLDDENLDKMDDKVFIAFAGSYFDLSERYEALLELLPQSAYSKAGTHPRWVADAVENNILIKDIVRDDVEMFIDNASSLAELKEELIEYFNL